LCIEPKFLRSYAWHELSRKADDEMEPVDVLVVSSVLPDLVYYFHVQHESMSRDDRTKNTAFMAHAIAGQMDSGCLAIGMLAKEPLYRPTMALAEPQGSPVINRDMSSIKISIDG